GLDDLATNDLVAQLLHSVWHRAVVFVRVEHLNRVSLGKVCLCFTHALPPLNASRSSPSGSIPASLKASGFSLTSPRMLSAVPVSTKRIRSSSSTSTMSWLVSNSGSQPMLESVVSAAATSMSASLTSSLTSETSLPSKCSGATSLRYAADTSAVASFSGWFSASSSTALVYVSDILSPYRFAVFRSYSAPPSCHSLLASSRARASSEACAGSIPRA